MAGQQYQIALVIPQSHVTSHFLINPFTYKTLRRRKQNGADNTDHADSRNNPYGKAPVTFSDQGKVISEFPKNGETEQIPCQQRHRKEDIYIFECQAHSSKNKKTDSLPHLPVNRNAGAKKHVQNIAQQTKERQKRSRKNMLHHAVPRIFPAGRAGLLKKHAYHAQKHQTDKKESL